MAFGKITKQDLIDAGFDPDQLKDLREKGVTKDDLAAMKGELNTTVTELITNQFKELETKLTAKGGNNDRGSDRSNNPDGNGDRGGDPNNQVDEPSEFLSDPTKFINKKVSNLGAAAAIEFKKMARQLAYDNAADRLQGFKNPEIKKEIDEEFGKYTPEVLARNNADPSALIKSVHDMVMGRHLHEIIADKDKKDGKFNFVTSGNDSGSGNTNNGSNRQSDKRTLSADEEKQAKKFGMTTDEWLKSIEESETENAARLAAIGGGR